MRAEQWTPRIRGHPCDEVLWSQRGETGTAPRAVSPISGILIVSVETKTAGPIHGITEAVRWLQLCHSHWPAYLAGSPPPNGNDAQHEQIRARLTPIAGSGTLR